MSVHLLRIRLYPGTRLLCRISSTRFYAQGPTRKPSSTTASVQSLAPVNADVPHEVHEKKTATNAPFNSVSGPTVGGSFASGSPLLDAALTTVVGLGMLLAGGVAYVAWYKKRVLDKIEEAFAGGYDPALELATYQTKYPSKRQEESEDQFETSEELPWIRSEALRRKEQDSLDHIIQGRESGHYFMLLGPKGSGKSSMLLNSMDACKAEGVSMCDAHPDLEVFRLRLGKALNYEFNEDTQTGLFQRRDPREGGPALDIERALNKLEKVALRSARRTGRPLVLIINNVHFFKNDPEGQNMILQLQQRAETGAASGILTLVFSSDDFWPFHIMRKSASRMHVLSIYDLDTQEAHRALTNMRKNNRRFTHDEVKEAVSIVGGRLSFLNKVARSGDMVNTAKNLLSVEKGWLLSQIGLIPDCDDDVMDEQKWSSCSWLLLQEFVRLHQEQEKALEAAREAGEIIDGESLLLPSIPYWRCRQIMTRADFLEDLDRSNIVTIDIDHNVRPDSMLVLHAAREVVEEEGFSEILANVRDRIDEIESLHRTRELTFKDLNQGDQIKLTVDKGGSVRLV